MDKPTLDMWRALLNFRVRHGRYWKRALSLKWMNGSDAFEHFSSSLRMVRNQFGPTWLYALRPAILDAAARRVTALDSTTGPSPQLAANATQTINDAGPVEGRGPGLCAAGGGDDGPRAPSIRRSP